MTLLQDMIISAAHKHDFEYVEKLRKNKQGAMDLYDEKIKIFTARMKTWRPSFWPEDRDVPCPDAEQE